MGNFNKDFWGLPSRVSPNIYMWLRLLEGTLFKLSIAHSVTHAQNKIRALCQKKSMAAWCIGLQLSDVLKKFEWMKKIHTMVSVSNEFLGHGLMTKSHT